MRVTDFDPLVLAKALQGPLPGVEAQLQLAHPARTLQAPFGKTPREAGVLILLYAHDDEFFFPLIERTSHNPQDRHRGQIGLPGGKRETQDADIIATAVREAEEEVGVPRESIEVLGALSTLYIPVSNFNVSPIVATTSARPAWIPQSSEVARIIEAPFAALQHAEAVKHTDRTVGEGVRLKQVPYFDVGGEVVWGATAMILSELRQVVKHHL